MVERALYRILVDAETSAGERITPLQLDRQATFPSITYQRISTPRDIAHDGDQGFAEFRTQMNCWAQRTESASGYAQARQLADEVRLALNGFRGTVEGIVIGYVQVLGDRDDVDPERTLERVVVDVVGNYQEARP